MKKGNTYTNLNTLGKIADTAVRGMQFPANGNATRRQKKHEMLVTFMANAKAEKRKPAPVRPRILTALLSIFF